MDAAKDQLNEAQYAYLQLLLDAGCKFLFRTQLAGKSYVWMRDRFGSIFLEKIPDTPSAFSVDGQTGEVTPVE